MKRIKVVGLSACVSMAVMAAGIIVMAGEDQKSEQSGLKGKAEIGKVAPLFTLTDATGERHALADYSGKYVVLEWINFGCPFVKKHYSSGNMQTLQARYAAEDVVWLSICSSAKGKQGWFEGEALLSRIKEAHSHAAAYLIDADGTVGRAYNAKTTPNMFIINPEGILIYSGAIDDTPSTNPRDIDGSVNYVDAALTSALAGKTIGVSTSVPYGCAVKY